MARMKRHLCVHYYFFVVEAMKVKWAIENVLKKDRLDDGDIQAVKTLTELYEELSNQAKRRDFIAGPNPSRGTDPQHQAECGSGSHQDQTSKGT